MNSLFASRRRASWRQHFVAVARAVELTARAAMAPEPEAAPRASVPARRPGIGHAAWLSADVRQQHPAA
jgi:hypothetical protein